VISHLKGVIEEIGADHLVVDIQGIGFKVYMPSRDISEAGRAGEETHLYTEMVVREDFIGLYGFSSQFGRHMFNLLCTVNGIGPKIAMSVLSASAPEKVAFAIAVGDAKGIIAPGVGKKLADRIVLELKNKVGPAGEVPEGYDGTEVEQEVSLSDDAMKALISLGYTRLEAENAVRKALKEEPAADLSRVIKMALGTFAGKR